jgi:hypothetical protein
MHVISISRQWWMIVVIAAAWEIVWKGVALWRASRRNEPGWFIALLILNTVGIFPILYLIFTQAQPRQPNVGK